MTAADQLRAAKEKISGPGAWIQGSYARTASGMTGIFGHEAGAMCFCALGALQAVTGSTFSASDRFLDQAAREHSYQSATGFNDAEGRTQAEVLALFDRAIQLAEAA